MTAVTENVYMAATNCSEIESLSISAGHDQSSIVGTVVCGDSSVSLNDQVTLQAGYDSDNGTILTGRVKNIVRTRPDGTIKIVVKDLLVDATDYFLASDDPDTPFSRENILSEDLVEDLLNEAGISSAVFNSLVPLSFTFGVQGPVEFNLLTSMDAINQICNILAWNLYAEGGQIYFADIQPYWRSGTFKDTLYGYGGNSDDEVSFAFCTDGSMTTADLVSAGWPALTINTGVNSVEYSISDEGIRNKIVVYGAEGILAQNQASSAYLPAGFYKTAVISSPLIDSQSMADGAADFNLPLLNRPTETVQMEVLGLRTLLPRRFVIIGDSFLGLDETQNPWFIESVNHTLGTGGYITRLALRR